MLSLGATVRAEIDKATDKAAKTIRMAEITKLDPLELEFLDDKQEIDEDDLDMGAWASFFLVNGDPDVGDTVLIAEKRGGGQIHWVLLDFLVEDSFELITQANFSHLEVALVADGPGVLLDQTGYGEAIQSAAANTAWMARLTTDSFARWRVRGDGRLEWGTGLAVPDVQMERFVGSSFGVGLSLDKIFYAKSGIEAADANSGSWLNTSGLVEGWVATLAETAFQAGHSVNGAYTEPQARFRILGSGAHEWSDGTTFDVHMKRENPGSGMGLSVDALLYAKAGLEAADADSGVFINIAGLMEAWPSALTDSALQIGYTNGGVWPDALPRLRILANGTIKWGDGSTLDVDLYRSAANVLALDDDFAINVAGKGLRIKEGSNAKMGVATLVGGTVTISTTAVTANSRIFYSVNVAGGTQGFLRISARTAGTSFVITSTSGSETSTLVWMLVEPA